MAHVQTHAYTEDEIQNPKRGKMRIQKIRIYDHPAAAVSLSLIP